MIDPKEKLRKVELMPYNSAWPQLFIEEKKAIAAILQENCVEIHHIGSTAIPDIYAKPIIDILPIVKDIHLVDALNHEFEKLGYTCMGEYGIKGRRFYWKSTTVRTHHIHLFAQGSSEITRHIEFKNFLIAHANYANAYSVMKRCLAEVFTYDIENYVNAKGSFVQMIEYKAGVAKPTQLQAPDNIAIQPYNPVWPKLAAAEIKTIKMLTELPYMSIDHLGSTAVPNLASKPTIDIFITTASIAAATRWIAPLESLGYCFWDENPDKSHLRFFKGMPPFGNARTHHIHIVAADNPTIEHRILFRDILIKDPQVRMEYEKLKLELSQSNPENREAYTDGKTHFIKNILQENGYQGFITR
ncbi:hypothetical protein BH10PSE19_BH10PSE19_00650 [soil metagenome]